MTGVRVRVIKLGGSLLDWPDWPSAFRRWRRGQPAAADVMVVGGGAFVERLRELDRMHGLSAEAAHWLAIRAMSLTARLAAELLPEAKLEKGIRTILARDKNSSDPFSGAENSSHAFFVVDVGEFLRSEIAAADALPASWDVTSDSIAARVARTLDADELVLLKSLLPECPARQEALAACGYVDAYFPRAARGLRVRCVNLRDEKFGQVVVDAQESRRPSPQ
jgi:aspartokinase-like uncharacterized kinase